MRGRTPGDPQPVPKDPGADPSTRLGREDTVFALFQDPDLEERLIPPGIQQPELGNAGVGVARRQGLGVFLLRGVAQDLDHQVRCAFELDEPPGPLSRGRDLPDSTGIEGGEEHHHQVRLDGKTGARSRDPGTVDEYVPMARLGDERGYFGRAIQSLVIEKR